MARATAWAGTPANRRRQPGSFTTGPRMVIVSAGNKAVSKPRSSFHLRIVCFNATKIGGKNGRKQWPEPRRLTGDARHLQGREIRRQVQPRLVAEPVEPADPAPALIAG